MSHSQDAAAPQPLRRVVLHQTHGIRPLLAVTLDVPVGTEVAVYRAGDVVQVRHDSEETRQAPEPLFTAIFEVIAPDGVRRIQLSPQQVEAFDLPDQVVAVYRADQTPPGITAEDVERAKFLAECADTPLMRDVMAERDAIAAAANGLLTTCRECRDERDFYTDPVKPADFIIWGKLAPPEGLGPKCYDHAVKHLGHDMPHRSDQYAVVDLRPIRAALDALEETDG